MRYNVLYHQLVPISMNVVIINVFLQLQLKKLARDGPFNLQGGRGGGVMFFFLKKYSDSQCCGKKYSDLVEGKTNNLIQSFCHIT